MAAWPLRRHTLRTKAFVTASSYPQHWLGPHGLLANAPVTVMSYTVDRGLALAATATAHTCS